MTFTILTLAGSYALVAALLAWLVIASRAHLVFKLVATAATALLIPLTYIGIGELRGLPMDAPPPLSFQLHWARVVEPNPLTDEPGHVFLWLEALDAENYPSGTPRAYQLPYDPDLVRKVEVVLGLIAGGEGVAGTIADEAEVTGEIAEDLAAEVRAVSERSGPDAGMVGDRGYRFEPGDLVFGEAPTPVTPEKPD